MQAPGPTLETARLILRPTASEDFEGWAELMVDPDSSRYIGGVQAPSAAWRGMATMAGSWAVLGFGMFSVIEKDSRRWVGRVGPWMPADWPGTEIGYGLLKSAWGKGYATEAAAASIDWAIDHLGWTDIIHCIDPDNAASQGVAKRLGSVKRGPGKMPPPFDALPTDIWGQTAAEWRARRR